MLPIKTFSPTQTDVFSFCPRAWGFYRNRLKPRCIGYPEIAAIVGTATAAGLEVFYKARLGRQTLDHSVIETVALHTASEGRTEALANGLRYVAASEQDKWDSIDSNIQLCLKVHAKADPFKDYEVVAVEQKDDHHGRKDLLLRDDAGLLVVDFKCKLTLRSEWLKKEFATWRRSWQLHHYAITAGAPRFAVALIAPHTRAGVAYEITAINPHYANLWIKDALQLWSEMDYYHDVPLEQLRGNTAHANQYGECVYWAEACSHGMDSAMVAANLIQLEPRKEAIPTCQSVS